MLAKTSAWMRGGCGRARARAATASAADENVMPALIEAAEADATVGEMMTTLKDVYGPYDGGPEM
jgi:methylmalonyl-CoA mutase N-terminal domain/subunit